jgi:hypothetical protein
VTGEKVEVEFFNILSDSEEVLKLCTNFQISLTVNSKSDIDNTTLCDELIGLKPSMSKIVKYKLAPHDVLIFLKRHNLQDLYPNTYLDLYDDIINAARNCT